MPEVAMDEDRIACEGVLIRSMYLPPFRLRAGEIACLHLPERIEAMQEEQLTDMLTGKLPIPGYHKRARVLRAERVRSPKWPMSLFLRPTLCDWLARNGGLSQIDALGVLDR